MPIQQIVSNPKKPGEFITKTVTERYEGVRPEERARVAMENAHRSRRGLEPLQALGPVANRRSAQHAPVEERPVTVFEGELPPAQQPETPPGGLVAAVDGPPDAVLEGKPDLPEGASAGIGERELADAGLTRVAKEPQRGRRQRRQLPPEPSAQELALDTDMDSGQPE